jgi:hypothetical protein
MNTIVVPGDSYFYFLFFFQFCKEINKLPFFTALGQGSNPKQKYLLSVHFTQESKRVERKITESGAELRKSYG